MNHTLKIAFLALLSAFLLNFSAYAEEAKKEEVKKTESNVIEAGKKVKMNFTMKSEGTILESTEGKEPFEFIFGKDPMIPGVEEALKGLKVGDKKELSLTPENAFGPVNPKAVVEFPRSQFKEKKIEAGMVFNGQGKGGVPLQGTVKEVKKNTVVLDFNHPLAGKHLDLDFEVIEVV